MKLKTLEDLFVDQLRDTYDAEHRIVKALPKMAKEASSDDLRSGFEMHLKQSEEHIKRIERVFEGMGTKATRKKCEAIVGLMEEGKEVMENDIDAGVKDAALIAEAQKVEHYEIASYGCLVTWAKMLGHEDASRELHQTLEEEKQTDQKLTSLSQNINMEALHTHM